ncbi:MAG: hypothetical protein IJ639_01105 [Ruminococcus sp.]|nr:hypothetical protein [Ruminococcus sp.]
MLPYTVCLFGHRQIENVIEVETALRAVIEKILAEHEYVEFLVGREGEFDILAASIIREFARSRYDGNCSLTLVMPYLRTDLKKNQSEYEEYYDSVELCEQSAAVHPKAAIRIRNRAMVDRSDLCIFYVTHPSGGAYQTKQYAEAAGKRIISLGFSL